ncbi:hypothetical protein F1721_33180 [Saccharopolyspora hirsuta]|uniref:Uncharacterized protein n=1 Tax=Saccharopolyspora hirsuta TaxID=1837 RepID=A0A5M7B7D6_SACHI|nr:hypothetical protein [Saccharopolyspora hirsuta]KAA5825483.1 hypothetical protein F1721_33180 [Saccharopolyspora hirsuta]
MRWAPITTQRAPHVGSNLDDYCERAGAELDRVAARELLHRAVPGADPDALGDHETILEATEPGSPGFRNFVEVLGNTVGTRTAEDDCASLLMVVSAVDFPPSLPASSPGHCELAGS